MKLKFSNHQVLFSETTYIVDKDRFLRCAKGAIALDIDADGWYCRRDTIINNPIHIKDGLKLILKDLQELRTYCNLLPDCNDSCLKKLTVYFTFQKPIDDINLNKFMMGIKDITLEFFHPNYNFNLLKSSFESCISFDLYLKYPRDTKEFVFSLLDLLPNETLERLIIRNFELDFNFKKYKNLKTLKFEKGYTMKTLQLPDTIQTLEVKGRFPSFEYKPNLRTFVWNYSFMTKLEWKKFVFLNPQIRFFLLDNYVLEHDPIHAKIVVLFVKFRKSLPIEIIKLIAHKLN